MNALSSLIAVSAVVGGLGVAHAVAAQTVAVSGPRCAGRGEIAGRRAMVVRSTSTVVIYDIATSREDGMGDRVDDVYACLKPAGRLSYVASNAPAGGSEYGSNLILTKLTLLRTYAIARQSADGAETAACNKYQAEPCPGPVSWLRLVDLRSGRSCLTDSVAEQTLRAILATGVWSCPFGSTPAAAAVTRYSRGLVTKNYASQPTSIAVGSDGALWFTDPEQGAIGRLDPTTGVISEYKSGIPVNSAPYDIAAGPDGNLWFTLVSPYASTATPDGAIGRIDPETDAITLYSIGLPADTQPAAITAGPDGALWFTSAPAPGFTHGAIGRIATATGAITLYTTGLRADSSPAAITLGPDGNVWFADPGQQPSPGAPTTPASPPAIGRIDPVGGALAEFTTGLPPDSSPVSLTSGPDGALWFTLALATGGAIGRLDPATESISTYSTGLPAGLFPSGITAGPGDALWFTAENAADGAVLAEVDPTSGAITAYGLPSGSPLGIVSGPDGDLWAADSGGPDFSAFGYPLHGVPPAIVRLAVGSLPAT